MSVFLKTPAAIILLLTVLQLKAQEQYIFKPAKILTATPVKNQEQTGTCWAFSATSFLESELIRIGKEQVNLSEMFIVRHVYRKKCENYVRRQGKTQFGEGGLAHDLLDAVANYGVVPEAVYPGRKDASAPYNHTELEKTLKATCDNLIKDAAAGKLKANWILEIDNKLDETFGTLPAKFKAAGLITDAQNYRDFLGIRTGDYVNITSFTHHPFYQPFVLEVPDNFSNGTFYNLPISEMMRCLNNALQLGYSVEWDADVSNAGFSSQNGIAVIPEKNWTAKTEDEKLNTFKFWEPEIHITQEIRQDLFDRQITTDDHLMHITGILDEVHSGIYYTVKNSWGEKAGKNGYMYVSEAYMRANTISITLHKEAIPADIRKQLLLEPGEYIIDNKTNRKVPAKQSLQGPVEPKTSPVNSINNKTIEKSAPKLKSNNN